MKFAAFAFIVCISVVTVTSSAINDAENEHRSGDSTTCIMKIVLNIAEVGKKWISDVSNCKETLNADEQAALDSMHEIVKASNNFTLVYEDNCKSEQRIRDNCTRQMRIPVFNIIANVVNSGRAVSVITESPDAMGACARNATEGLEDYFWSILDKMKNCL